mgnify:CR=1 FL=1
MAVDQRAYGHRAIAARLVAEGCEVGIFDLDLAAAKATAEAIQTAIEGADIGQRTAVVDIDEQAHGIPSLRGFATRGVSVQMVLPELVVRLPTRMGGMRCYRSIS